MDVIIVGRIVLALLSYHVCLSRFSRLAMLRSDSVPSSSLFRPTMGRLATGEESHGYLDSTTRIYYKSLLLLGKGGFAKCYKVRDESTHEHWALKVIDKKNMSDNQYHKVMREIKIHKGLNHPHIVRLASAFEDESNVHILMELCCDKSLLSLINESTRLNEQDSQYYLRGIVSAVTFLLSYDIIHRDIKPGNILLKESGNRTVVKLADFGLACMIKDVSGVSVSGTPNYLAPEVLKRKGHSAASEAWSIGCLLFCMVVGLPPFDSTSIQETYRRIEGGEYKYPTHISLSSQVISLIDGLLKVVVAERLGVFDINTSAFMRSYSVKPALTSISNSRGSTVSSSRMPSIISTRYSQSTVPHSIPSPRPKYSPLPSLPPPPLPPRPTVFQYSQGMAQSTYGFDTTRSQQSQQDSSSSLSISPSLPSILFSDLDIHASTLTSLISGVQSISPVRADPPLHVSKWVDYSNKYGFGCLLSDGTTTVKFNSGEIVALRSDCTGVYTKSHSTKPIPLNMRDPHIVKLVDLTKNYKGYMETQLAKAAREAHTKENRRWNDMSTPYMTHFSKKNKSVMVVLSDGTTQINFTDAHIKLIISPDSSTSSLISFIGSDGVFTTYRTSCLPSSPKSLSSSLLSLIQDSSEFISSEMVYLRSSRHSRPLTTSC